MAKQERKQYTEEELSQNYQRAHRIIKPFFRFLFPNRVLRTDRIPERSVLICPNHFSNLDPLAVCFAVPRKKPLRIMAKQELLNIPILGRLLNRWGIFGVKRGKSDVGAIKTALRHLKAGETMMMFPEGTRVKEGEDNEAKTGAIMLAARTKTPILPCYCQRRKHIFQCTTIIFGEPYEVEVTGKDYTRAAEDLIHRIYALKGEIP